MRWAPREGVEQAAREPRMAVGKRPLNSDHVHGREDAGLGEIREFRRNRIGKQALYVCRGPRARRARRVERIDAARAQKLGKAAIGDALDAEFLRKDLRVLVAAAGVFETAGDVDRRSGVESVMLVKMPRSHTAAAMSKTGMPTRLPARSAGLAMLLPE